MKDGSHATAITHARTSKPSCDHAAFSRQCDLTLTVLGPKQSLKGLENGVDGIILRVTDKDGAGARAGVVDGDLLQSIGGKQCASLDYDVQLKLVIDAKGTGVVDVGVLRRGAVAETSLSNTADDINRTQSYLVANPKVSSQKYFFLSLHVFSSTFLFPLGSVGCKYNRLLQTAGLEGAFSSVYPLCTWSCHYLRIVATRR